MRYYVIIPAHNEAGFIHHALDSLLAQTLAPEKVIVVNDNSTDNTGEILQGYAAKHPLFHILNSRTAAKEHMPGSKVIHAFSKGLEAIHGDYDFMVKLDADLILPDHYFERIANTFSTDTTIGIAGGFIYELGPKGTWELNHPMDKDHVRGAFKAYSKPCFKAIGGLKSAIGWDTVDELLASYHGFSTHTDASLQVKHLRPTGKAYNPKARFLQGRAMYTMRYGFWITLIASLKMVAKQKKWGVFNNNIKGYLDAKQNKADFLISETEGRYIRRLRWARILEKLRP